MVPSEVDIICKSKLENLVYNLIIFIGLFLLFGFIHELGHIIVGLLRGDRIISVGFFLLEDANIFSLSMAVEWDYNFSSPEGLIYVFIAGSLFTIIIASIVLVFAYYKKFKILVISSWFNLTGQFSYLLISSILNYGDMKNIFWYIEEVFLMEYNILSFSIPFLIIFILLTILLFHLVLKFYFPQN